MKRKLTGDELAQVESMLKMARDSRNTTGRDSMAFENLEVQDFYAVGVDVAPRFRIPAATTTLSCVTGIRYSFRNTPEP